MQIHELNTFAGTPGDNNFLAIDNGADTGKISGTNLLKPVNDRIDNLAAACTPDSVVTLIERDNIWAETVNLADDVSNYDFIDLYFKNGNDTPRYSYYIRVPRAHFPIVVYVPEKSGTNIYISSFTISLSGTTATVSNGSLWSWSGVAADGATSEAGVTVSSVCRIDGVKTSTNTSAEIADLRIGYDGVTYLSAGDMVRTNDGKLDAKISAVRSAAFYYDVAPYTWIDGKIVSAIDGSIVSNASYSYFKTSIENADVIYVKTNISSIAGIVFYDENDAFIKGIRNVAEVNPFETIIEVPHGAASIAVTCLYNDKNNATILTGIKTELNYLRDKLANKIDYPLYYIPMQYTVNQGIIHRNGTVYNPGGSYEGRYAFCRVSAGDKIRITGHAYNGNYPGGVFIPDVGTNIGYKDTAGDFANYEITVSTDGTMYVNGSVNTVMPSIEILTSMTQQEVASRLLSGFIPDPVPMKAKYASGTLYIKKRISDSKSICVSFAHVGGNSLFNFASIFYIDETPGAATNDSFASNGTSIGASATDWFGPYVIQAVNNADGDVPAGNSYFTGGNHRSNNTAIGGGITAKENSLAITIDGITPADNTVYNAVEIIAKWSNDVQGNNTSKSDGTGRAILTENWTVRITIDGIVCENDIAPKEELKLITYYGLQVYDPGANVIYKGGTTRIAKAINSISNSGNKTCRCVNIVDSNFSFYLSVFPEDLGLFDNSPYSFFTTNANKLYTYAVANQITADVGEHYYLKGKYDFW